MTPPTPQPTLGSLTLNAVAREGGQTVTVTPAKDAANMLRYKITAADAKPTVNYDDACISADGWQDFPSNGQVSGTSGQVITVVEMTTQGAKARKKGEAVLPAPSPIRVTGITLGPNNAAVTVGYRVQLKATVAPDNATNKGIDWSSADETKATVNSSGLVSGVAAGTVAIKAVAKDGSGVNASINVTVNAA